MGKVRVGVKQLKVDKGILLDGSLMVGRFKNSPPWGG